MSILFEALKKSEAQRQLGKTPTLETPTDLPAAAQRPAGRWLETGMVIFAISVMAWVGWDQFRPPEGAPARQTLAGDETVERPRAAAAGTGETGGGDEAGAAKIAPEPRPLVSMGAQRKSSGEDVEEKRRLLGQTFRTYSSEQEAEKDAGSRAADDPTETVPPVDPEPAAAAPPPVSAEPAMASAREPRREPPAEQTISYWQIPPSMREGMPELHIRVLVYADRSEDRFLLLNDKRLREGEELEPGLRLEEIQRDRAIFSYRNYRFHLKS